MSKSEDITFEQAISRLEEIVQALDGGELSLDESLKLFEEGIGLTRSCSKQLNDAQGKLEKLIKKSDGSIKAEPLEM